MLTAVGGFAAASHHDTSVLALAIVGMLAAGVDLPLAELLVVFLAGVLAVEIGAVSYGHTDLGTVLGYPALLAGLGPGRPLPARLPDPDRAGRGAARRDPPGSVRG